MRKLKLLIIAVTAALLIVITTVSLGMGETDFNRLPDTNLVPVSVPGLQEAMQQTATPYPEPPIDGSYLPILAYVFILAGVVVVFSLVFIILERMRDH